MSRLTDRIELTPEERALILKHGYPFDRLAKPLPRHASNGTIKTISISAYELEMLIGELEMLIGELSRPFNHGQCGQDEGAVLDLCNRLEYAEQYGDGDLDILP